MQFDLQRKRMISRLENQGITDTNVLEAMYHLPRHRFVAEGFSFQAYDEKALPIGYGQTISHPFTVARMTQILKLKPHEKVLEIGTGSGYQTALLCALGARVFTIEIIPELIEQAKMVLSELKYTVAIAQKDGSTGWRSHAPYDAIIVTAGAPVTPESLLDQLGENGRLLVPIGSREQQQLWIYEKQEKGFAIHKFDHLVFVPLVGKEGWQKNE
jgi:protein-L-isoaspartate(D-aspartate) O-methyltransferase